MSKTIIPTRITGIGKGVPERVVTNQDIEKVVDTNDEWITTRSGIKERRMVSGDETGVSLSVTAANEAMAFAGITAGDLDLIICATSLPDNLYPSAACEIQRELNCGEIPAFDLRAACSGLVYGLSVARSFIGTGAYKKILLVGVDLHSRFVNWEDRGVCVLFGDGACAMIVEASEDDRDDIIEIDLKSDGHKGCQIKLPLTGKNCPVVEPNTPEEQHVYMNGREVYKFAVTDVPAQINYVLNKAGLTPEDVDHYILHQANIRIIDTIIEKLNLSKDKFYVNLQKYGNTSAASIGIAMQEALEEGVIKKDSILLFSGFGAGLTWGSAIVKWRGEDKRK